MEGTAPQSVNYGNTLPLAVPRPKTAEATSPKTVKTSTAILITSYVLMSTPTGS